MGKYEDWDLIKDHVKSMSTDGYFRILYVYVGGEYGYYEIRIELEKLTGWEGYYDEYIYREQLDRLKRRIEDDVIYDLDFHRPRIEFYLKN